MQLHDQLPLLHALVLLALVQLHLVHLAPLAGLLLSRLQSVPVSALQEHAAILMASPHVPLDIKDGRS
jgi:hypothetical protein